MIQIKKDPSRLTIARYLRNTLNIFITIMALVCVWLMISEIYDIVLDSISIKIDENEILKKILMFFIYFEIIAMIIKYFEENYHFPTRYLIYIAITGILRYIMIEHTNLINASIAIFILVVTYVILEYKNKKLGNKEKGPSWEKEIPEKTDEGL
jgi:protein PsiE